MRRSDWHTYFMEIAVKASERATCSRKSVGAVLVRDKMILSTGYNGSVRGMPHCTDVGCIMEDNHCVATIHAEANAILQAARLGVATAGAHLYTTASPCWICFKQAVNAGITTIVFKEFYRDERIFAAAITAGISLTHLLPPLKSGIELKPVWEGEPP